MIKFKLIDGNYKNRGYINISTKGYKEPEYSDEFLWKLVDKVKTEKNLDAIEVDFAYRVIHVIEF